MHRLTHQFTAEQLVRLEKIAPSSSPLSSSVAWDDWKHGSPDNSGSLPVSYNLEGYLMVPIRVGKPIQVIRSRRNEVNALGYFCSTKVIEIREDNLVVTCNSIYRISFLSELKKEAQ